MAQTGWLVDRVKTAPAILAAPTIPAWKVMATDVRSTARSFSMEVREKLWCGVMRLMMWTTPPELAKEDPTLARHHATSSKLETSDYVCHYLCRVGTTFSLYHNCDRVSFRNIKKIEVF